MTVCALGYSDVCFQHARAYMYVRLAFPFRDKSWANRLVKYGPIITYRPPRVVL